MVVKSVLVRRAERREEIGQVVRVLLFVGQRATLQIDPVESPRPCVLAPDEVI
jgi:hypothetical protein